jgi:hypothetical protein
MYQTGISKIFGDNVTYDRKNNEGGKLSWVLQAINLFFFSSSSLFSAVDNTVSTVDSSLSYKRALLHGVVMFIVERETR